VFFVVIAAIISFLVIRLRREEPAQRSRLTV
jgi:preprotein translocase subunit YajC